MDFSETSSIMSTSPDVLQTYCLYATILALKLVMLKPLATYATCHADKLERFHFTGLKYITPFWVIGALYTTTNPDPEVALPLFRVFVLGRLVMLADCLTKVPREMKRLSFFSTIVITAFMGVKVLNAYKSAF
ncbi:hypothetical protein JYU34_017651 [Plutella xylostella]|uniref:Glutathione transferase n=1 Tax=Plutella xylostella TaxID=51655 RepID=A0ABQ7Q1V3_PLUXY|nr:microsomal glutathione S-transferase 1-like [Plutella xylostella]KAG7299135.1 hypothetical protein JYU34_017651 [Plutella xylostella]